MTKKELQNINAELKTAISLLNLVNDDTTFDPALQEMFNKAMARLHKVQRDVQIEVELS